MIRLIRQAFVVLYDHLISLVCLAIFGVVGFLYSVVSFPFLLVPARWSEPMGKRILQGLFRFYTGCLWLTGRIRLDLRQLDVLNGEKGMILAPNHPSLIDAVLIMSRVRKITCVAKASLWNNPALMGGIRLARFIPNRSPAYMVKAGERTMKQGNHLLLFPEGTRTVRFPVNEFRGIVAIMARKAGAMVQPVFLEYTGKDGGPARFLGKNHSIFRFPYFPIVLRARLGKRFQIEEGEESKDFLNRMEAYYRAELESGIAGGQSESK